MKNAVEEDNLRLALELPAAADVAAELFDRCFGFAEPAAAFPSNKVRELVLHLEQRRESGELVREVGHGMVLYYPPDAADLDDDGRVEVAGEVSDQAAANFGIEDVPYSWTRE